MQMERGVGRGKMKVKCIESREEVGKGFNMYGEKYVGERKG